MAITCKNCDNHFRGHFCNNCGQSAQTHKINFHYLWHDIQHGLFHFDNGLFYTIKQLFTRPGNSIREFIEGKRVKHFKPISLVIILATVYGILFHTFHIEISDTIKIKGLDKYAKLTDWINNHYAVTTLFTLPFYALGTFNAFRKQGYNFVEHLVMNAFLAGQRLAVHIALFPLIVFFNGTPDANIISSLIMFIVIGLTVWSYSQFFNKLTFARSLLLTVLSYLIAALSSLVVVVIIGMLLALLKGK